MDEPVAGSDRRGAVSAGAGSALRRWFDEVQRPLPWRGSRDPYRIWVSEVMLQQTRVETVLPYYRRFLERFPTVEALAAAEPEEVLALWSGLGYYRRARQMHAAAGRLVDLDGWPRTVEGLRELPGVGPYTAAAVASLAFGVAEPVVDGNVERVASRVLAMTESPKTAAGRRRVRELAAALLDPDRPGDSNQALMELGATVCLPRSPRCPRCPLAADCRALAAGEPERYPVPRRRPASRRLRRVGAVVRRDGRVLLFRRPEDEALLAGMWEVPWVPHGARRRVEASLAERYGGDWRLGVRRGRVRHAVTTRRYEVEVREAELEDGGGIAEGPEAGWFGPAELGALPVSSLVRKILRLA